MTKIIHAEGLEFELLNKEHLPYIMTWVNDPDVTFYFANLQKHRTEEEELAYINQMVQSPYDYCYSVFKTHYGTENKREYIGQISINQINLNSKIGRIFMVITKEKQGNGYATQMLEAIKNIGFITHKLHKLWLIVREDNQKGRLIYRKACFETEDVLRKEYKVHDTYFNMVRMGLLREDWELIRHGA